MGGTDVAQLPCPPHRSKTAWTHRQPGGPRQIMPGATHGVRAPAARHVRRSTVLVRVSNNRGREGRAAVVVAIRFVRCGRETSGSVSADGSITATYPASTGKPVIGSAWARPEFECFCCEKKLSGNAYFGPATPSKYTIGVPITTPQNGPSGGCSTGSVVISNARHSPVHWHGPTFTRPHASRRSHCSPSYVPPPATHTIGRSAKRWLKH